MAAFCQSLLYLEPCICRWPFYGPNASTPRKTHHAKTTSIDRFDIVVASETDSDGKEKLIVKRVIGMPGDTIRYENDVLYVNDQKWTSLT